VPSGRRGLGSPQCRRPPAGTPGGPPSASRPRPPAPHPEVRLSGGRPLLHPGGGPVPARSYSSQDSRRGDGSSSRPGRGAVYGRCPSFLAGRGGWGGSLNAAILPREEGGLSSPPIPRQIKRAGRQPVRRARPPPRLPCPLPGRGERSKGARRGARSGGAGEADAAARNAPRPAASDPVQPGGPARSPGRQAEGRLLSPPEPVPGGG
jgi:hypothetical protein